MSSEQGGLRGSGLPARSSTPEGRTKSGARLCSGVRAGLGRDRGRGGSGPGLRAVPPFPAPCQFPAHVNFRQHFRFRRHGARPLRHFRPLPPSNGSAGVALAPNAKRARRGQEAAGAQGAPWRRGSPAMAAVPQNNLREQLRRHSARGALRTPAAPRDRPP